MVYIFLDWGNIQSERFGLKSYSDEDYLLTFNFVKEWPLTFVVTLSGGGQDVRQIFIVGITPIAVIHVKIGVKALPKKNNKTVWKSNNKVSENKTTKCLKIKQHSSFFMMNNMHTKSISIPLIL